VLLRILLQLPESTPFLATAKKLIYIKALCQRGWVEQSPCCDSPYTRCAIARLCPLDPKKNRVSGVSMKGRPDSL